MLDNKDGHSMQNFNPKLAAAAMIIAGVIHLWIVPHHWEHAQAHGMLMAFAGLVEIGWGILYFIKPTSSLRIAGILIAIGLISLWVITRFLPAPFTNSPEEVDLAGIATKSLEEFSSIILILGVIRASPEQKTTSRTWQSVISVVLLALFMCLAVYEVARASEPLLPGLVSQEAEHEHEHDE